MQNNPAAVVPEPASKTGSKESGAKESSGTSNKAQTTVPVVALGSTSKSPKSRNALLLVAKASIVHPVTKDYHPTNIFLDGGSQRTFVSHAFASSLHLPGEGVECLTIKTFGNASPKIYDSRLVHFDLLLNDGNSLPIEANVQDELTRNLHLEALSTEDVEFLQNLPANYVASDIPFTAKDFMPDILIGNDYFWDIVQMSRKTLPSGLHLISSKLGLLLGGRAQFDGTEDNSSSGSYPIFVSSIHNADSYSQNYNAWNAVPEALWQLETTGIRDSSSDEDAKAWQQFQNSVEFENGTVLHGPGASILRTFRQTTTWLSGISRTSSDVNSSLTRISSPSAKLSSKTKSTRTSSRR